MDQSHTSGDQAQERCFLRHGIARDQLLVEPRGGIGGDRGAVEERGGGDGHGCNAKRFHAIVSFSTDTGLKDPTDLGGSLLL